MFEFLTNLFRKSKHRFKYVRDKDYGGWIVYDENFPHVTALGKTKEEARESLLEDMSLIKELQTKEQPRSNQQNDFNKRQPFAKV